MARDETAPRATYAAPVAVALTGASGVQYGLRLIECLVGAGHEVYVMVSKAAHRVVAVETDIDLPAQPDRLARSLTDRFGAGEGQIRCFGR
ncbi:flavoprotein, partial [Salinicola salarius]|uniref:flavoprotein n=1 Tax=Salinicola salarius TaxID=430457 RepID=UPI0026EF0C73